MKRIAKIIKEQQIGTDDSVDSKELDYLLKSEKSLLDDRQYFSWNPSPKSVTTSLFPHSKEDTLLPDLDLDGYFDDKESAIPLDHDQPLLEDLDLTGVSFDDPESYLSQNLDSNAEEVDIEESGALFDDDELYSFVSEYDGEESSDAEDEPDWLDLAGEADEFDDLASTAFEDVEIEGAVGRTERAFQTAMNLGTLFDLDEPEIQVIAAIFEENGWSACKTAIIRELENGTSIMELELTSDIKQIWLEHIEFYNARLSNYRLLSWPTALKLVNSFTGYPSIEEMEQLLVSLYDHWQGSKVQRLISRSFNEYLIAYLSRVINGFEYAPEWAIELESSFPEYHFSPPSTEDIPAIHDFELERVLRNVRRNSIE